MIQVSSAAELRAALGKHNTKKVGFVPTMGYLHEGHLSLVSQAQEMSEIVVMSIFVNPLQFGPNEDFDKYPRDIERDRQLAEQSGVDILFTPTVEEMYPVYPQKTVVSVSGVTERLCGASRPGHFDGVSTVVNKLFNMVQPDYAFFGQKDAQQVAVIEKMVLDLNMPVQIVPCPTLREPDGLAKSSRNVYLSEEARQQATALYESLQAAKQKVEQGEDNASKIRDFMIKLIEDKPLAEIDYVEILSYPELEPVTTVQDQRIIIALAVRFGQTRLIDNMILQ